MYCLVCKNTLGLNSIFDNQAILDVIRDFIGTEEVPQNGQAVYICDTCIQIITFLGIIRKGILNNLLRREDAEPFMWTPKMLHILSNLCFDDSLADNNDAPELMTIKEIVPYNGEHHNIECYDDCPDALDLEIETLSRSQSRMSRSQSRTSQCTSRATSESGLSDAESSGAPEKKRRTRRSRKTHYTRSKSSKYKTVRSYAKSIVSKHATQAITPLNHYTELKYDENLDEDDSECVIFIPPDSPQLSERVELRLETARTRSVSRQLEEELGCINDDETLICSKCGEECATTLDLEIHEDLHYPFFCEICNEHFESIEDYKKHWTLHLEKSVPCQHCGKRYINRKVLNRHVDKCHGGHQYCCEVCKKIFPSEQRLLMHWRIHVENSITCKHCGKKYINNSVLDKHIEKNHMNHRKIDYKKQNNSVVRASNNNFVVKYLIQEDADT